MNINRNDIIATAVALAFTAGAVFAVTQVSTLANTASPASATEEVELGTSDPYFSPDAIERQAAADAEQARLAEEARIAAEAEAARVAAEAEAARIAQEAAAQAAREAANRPAPAPRVNSPAAPPAGYNNGSATPPGNICEVLADGTQVPCQG